MMMIDDDENEIVCVRVLFRALSFRVCSVFPCACKKNKKILIKTQQMLRWILMTGRGINFVPDRETKKVKKRREILS